MSDMSRDYTAIKDYTTRDYGELVTFDKRRVSDWSRELHKYREMDFTDILWVPVTCTAGTDCQQCFKKISCYGFCYCCHSKQYEERVNFSLSLHIPRARVVFKVYPLKGCLCVNYISRLYLKLHKECLQKTLKSRLRGF